MRTGSLLLMPAGWLIVLAAVVLLTSGPAQVLFVLVSIGIELTGFVLLARSYSSINGERN
jgi:hypothetical protein